MMKGAIELWGRTATDMEAQKSALLEDWLLEMTEFAHEGIDALPDITMPHDVFREVVRKALGEPTESDFAMWDNDPAEGFFARLSDPVWVRSALSGCLVADALSTRAALAVEASLEDLVRELALYRTDGFVPICDSDGGRDPLLGGDGTGGVPWPNDLGEVVAAATCVAPDGSAVPSGYPVSISVDPTTNELLVDMGDRSLRYALVAEELLEPALDCPLHRRWAAFREARAAALVSGCTFPLADVVTFEKEMLPVSPEVEICIEAGHGQWGERGDAR